MVSPLRAARPTNPAVCPQWTGCISPLWWHVTVRMVGATASIFGVRQPAGAR